MKFVDDDDDDAAEKLIKFFKSSATLWDRASFTPFTFSTWAAPGAIYRQWRQLLPDNR